MPRGSSEPTVPVSAFVEFLRETVQVMEATVARMVEELREERRLTRQDMYVALNAAERYNTAIVEAVREGNTHLVDRLLAEHRSYVEEIKSVMNPPLPEGMETTQHLTEQQEDAVWAHAQGHLTNAELERVLADTEIVPFEM
jgi:hypothetical protein